jgi:hypothetical protein
MDFLVVLVEAVDILLVQQEVLETLHPYLHRKETMEEMEKLLPAAVVVVREEQDLLVKEPKEETVA